MMHRWKAGFTLVEILVVVALIGVIASIGLAGAYTASRRHARDAARRTDIEAVQTGFEQYFLTNNAYADNCNTMFESAEIFVSGKPTDPRDPDRTYTFSCTDSSYCVCAELEMDDRGNSTDANCDFASVGDKNYFCAINVQ